LIDSSLFPMSHLSLVFTLKKYRKMGMISKCGCTKISKINFAKAGHSEKGG